MFFGFAKRKKKTKYEIRISENAADMIREDFRTSIQYKAKVPQIKKLITVVVKKLLQERKIMQKEILIRVTPLEPEKIVTVSKKDDNRIELELNTSTLTTLTIDRGKTIFTAIDDAIYEKDRTLLTFNGTRKKKETAEEELVREERETNRNMNDTKYKAALKKINHSMKNPAAIKNKEYLHTLKRKKWHCLFLLKERKKTEQMNENYFKKTDKEDYYENKFLLELAKKNYAEVENAYKKIKYKSEIYRISYAIYQYKINGNEKYLQELSKFRRKRRDVVTRYVYTKYLQLKKPSSKKLEAIVLGDTMSGRKGMESRIKTLNKTLEACKLKF